MLLFLVTLFLIAISIAGISIKIISKKNGKFSGTCASQNPFLNKDGEPCSLCGKIPE
ncbi:MAG: membrane or secreted protein, partial [Bacteroidota bacterium]|nr:membrane or secreted protein [Bacteroidota bacterium]